MSRVRIDKRRLPVLESLDRLILYTLRTSLLQSAAPTIRPTIRSQNYTPSLMITRPATSRTRSPKIHHMLIFIVALTFAFYVFAGKSAPAQADLKLGSVALEESYLLYFEPLSDKDPEKTLANRKRYSSQYEAIVMYGLDGDLNQQYDTLIVGFSFALSYTEKVINAIGLNEIPDDVEAATLARIREFLESYAGADMVKDNVRMVLEKDGEVSIQK